MIEEILAFILLVYMILYGLKINMSKEKFDKIVYHSKATKIIAQIISMIASATIVMGLMMFNSVAILTILELGLLEQIIINNGWDTPFFMFLTFIGALTIIMLPFMLWSFLPFYGNKKLSHRCDCD